MENIINETGNRADTRNSRLGEAVEWISDKEDKIMENDEDKQKIERRIMGHEHRLRELNDSIKHNNISITGRERKFPQIYLRKY